MISYSLDELKDDAIILCPECKGEGIILNVGELNNDVHFCTEEKCTTCDGRGRVKIRFEKLKE